MQVKTGLKLVARRAGCPTEQPYDQGVVVKLGKNGVFYTAYDDDTETLKKWVPTDHNQYKMTLSNGKHKLSSVNFTNLVFSE